MTIHHTPRRPGLTIREGKRRIAAIVHANPAIEGSIQDLVDHDSKGPLSAKRNRAVFAVYINNAVFGHAVDTALA